MEDEKYVFIEDVKTRKDVARSARKKKNGAKSRKVTFPSDYLTKKEREKMNGECKTWNMNEFYTYKEFKQMPDDIQVAYLTTLVKKYKIGIGTISKCQFGLSAGGLYAYLSKKKLLDLVPHKKFKIAPENTELYIAAIDTAKKVKEEPIQGGEESADIFIPDGMAPGYCSDGTKVKDAIKEAMPSDYVAPVPTVDDMVAEHQRFVCNLEKIRQAYHELAKCSKDIKKKIAPAPGYRWVCEYCSDGTKVEDAIKEAVDAANKKLMEDGSMSVSEFINLPYTRPKLDDAPVTRLNVTMNGIDRDRIADILSWFTGKDVTVTLIVNEKFGTDDLV